MQRIYSSQHKLEKEGQIEELTLPNFKNFYKPMVNKQKPIAHICVSLFWGFLLCPIDLFVYRDVNTNCFLFVYHRFIKILEIR